MKRAAWAAVVIVVVALGAGWLWLAHRAAPAITGEQSPPALAHPALAADLSPLYAGADWLGTQTEIVTVGTTSYSGASAASAAIDAGMNPAAVFSPFEQYYDAKLTALGWRIANDLAAGGHTGGQTGYRKGSSVILVRFGIAYQTNPPGAPSACPCDVTLSVFSSP